jgi:hypothetical protein
MFTELGQQLYIVVKRMVLRGSNDKFRKLDLHAVDHKQDIYGSH